MGIEVAVEGLTKSFGSQTIWRDVDLTLPAGEVTVLLGPSGTGKTVFLKSLIGLIKPEKGTVRVDGVDMVNDPDRRVFRERKRFGLMFQDGAMFGSLNLYDNIAFPLREHTRKTEAEIRRIVLEKMDTVGLGGEEKKVPGQISGGMRKRAGLARALVMDPEVILCDEPDSGLDPVRTAHLSQLLIDVNARIDATMLIVTHNIEIACTVPDNIGMLYRRDLVAFGPRETVISSEDPVIAQFLRGSPEGPIGMSEEKDAALLAEEAERAANRPRPKARPIEIPAQLQPSPGEPERAGEIRHAARVDALLPSLPPAAVAAIRRGRAASAEAAAAAAAQSARSAPRVPPQTLQAPPPLPPEFKPPGETP
ncbi:ABC transporter ATP-binding protein [Actinomadura oligospora]|uniref:ABC transporter ATP-binding protein n=1 Tax=Actinomadura oligospora TaxID=111804 RepID=UPI0004ADA163|nr:ATP-binding cassette domain-containing protein [Actinomadura oligospora]